MKKRSGKANPVPQWLLGQYLDWQQREGARKTLNQFAEYIGVHRAVLDKWLNGSRIPSARGADMLAPRLGPEIYDLLGLPRNDPVLREIIRRWGEYSETRRNLLTAMVLDKQLAALVARWDRATEEQRGPLAVMIKQHLTQLSLKVLEQGEEWVTKLKAKRTRDRPGGE